MLRTFAVVFLATASVLSAARAEFVIDYAGSQRLSESTRLGFVMGAMDRLTATMGGDAGWAAFYDGTRTCTTFRVRSTAGALEQAVGDTYRANPELWGLSAVSILQYVVHRLCEPEINQRRQAAGVESITSATYLANMMRPPVRWEGLEGAEALLNPAPPRAPSGRR